jgi:histidinol dehydrogenase
MDFTGRVPVYDYSPGSPGIERVMRRYSVSNSVDATSAEIMAEVRQRGDAALRKFGLKYDGVELAGLRVSEKEIALAYEQLSPAVLRALKRAYRNIRKVCEAQLSRLETWSIEVEPGIEVGEKWVPLESTGLYVPCGKGSFPSVMLMLAVPAKVAGVKRIVVCTPPQKQMDAATLVAADLIGGIEIYKAGGAGAIAAMAYGTETIPKVEKITGPGSPYVVSAKKLASNDVALGTPAGPSEICVVADGKADATVAAMEAVVEAEHGPDSSSVVITTSMQKAREIVREMEALVAELPAKRREFATSAISNYGGIIVAKNTDAALEVANEYAAEHLVLLVEDELAALGKIRNAGAVFLGKYSSVVGGCYATGSNAILPTGGWAKSCSATSVRDFMKCYSFERLDEKGARALAQDVVALAKYEGFPAHANAMKRFIGVKRG